MLSTLKKINFLITKRQRKGLVILALLLFVGMILEVLGLGILIPTLSIIIDPESINESIFLTSIRNFFITYSYKSFTLLFLFSIIILYLFKSLFLIFLNFTQNNFINNIIANISNKLFLNYLSQPYNFHLSKNSSELIKNIHLEIGFLGIYLLSLITVFIEAGFILAILITIVLIEPKGAISIGLFYGLLSVIFFQFTKKKLKRWGALRLDIDSQVSKIAMESLGGIKDLLILGNTSYFIKKYSTKNFLKAKLTTRQATVSQIPRYFLEFISILGLISFIILLIVSETDTSTLFTTLGVFVAATFRMIPSFNRIISGIQTMKYYSNSVDVIYKESIFSNNIFNKIRSVNYILKNDIEFRDVEFGYEKGSKILENINFKILKGEMIGIVGESGSGKSTFIDLIIGLHQPISGGIKIDGIDVNDKYNILPNLFGYVSQSIFLTDDSIKNNIALGIPENEIDSERIKDLIKIVQLEKFILDLTQGVDSKVGERGVQLSGGQRQRIGIARALYNNPDILILDEATSALDSETENEIIKAINNLRGEKTIIMIAHRISTLKNCDSIYKIENKNIKKVKK